MLSWSTRLIATCLIVAGCSLVAAETPTVRVPYAVLRHEHLRAAVPRARADELAPLVARAEALYLAMAQAAGHQARPLWLWLADDGSWHNGFSTVIPRPLIQVDLAPPAPDSSIFDGGDHVWRTLVHELAHHISNDRNHGFRRILESIFGRVLPNDPLSLLIFYLSAPGHVTMPAFWHEGLAIWAETAVSEADAPWGGRGRDSLTHMLWRLDAAGPGIPEVGQWRLSRPRWPYGGTAYAYGAAYLRHLVGAGHDPWALIADQARRWPFAFGGGSQGQTGRGHGFWLEQARTDLSTEQDAILSELRALPITPTPRLSPSQGLVGMPSWSGDALLFTWQEPGRAPRIARLAADGSLRRGGAPGHGRPALRRVDDDLALGTAYDHRLRPRLLLVDAQGRGRQSSLPLVQADGRRQDSGLLVVGLRNLASAQELVVAKTDARGRALAPARPLPSTGRPWSPCLRPGAEQLVWTESDDTGMRLVLGGLDGTGRQVLHAVPARILHPVFETTGRRLFFASDASGVANAYALDLDEAGVALGPAQPVTHVLGGVLAAVPSPDGRELALLDHDHEGPYLSRVALDPSTWPAELPRIRLVWPAPLDHDPAETPVAAPLPEPPPPATPRPYRGLLQLRPLYWTPTTMPVDSGGWGIAGLAADPLFTHILSTGIGIGPAGQEAVGHAAWLWRGPLLDLSLSATRRELSYGAELAGLDGRSYDYVETRNGAELAIGRSLSALDRGFSAALALGGEGWRRSNRAARDYEGLASDAAFFRGDERYLELRLGYDDRRLGPRGYAPEGGIAVGAQLRRSGLGGDLERWRGLLVSSAGIPLWRERGVQLSLSGRVGASDGDRIAQGAFAIGGALGLDLPRGYSDTEAQGSHLLTGSLALRVPVWRPFRGRGSSPLVHRQVVVEAFVDAGMVYDGQVFDPDGDWYRSTGLMLHGSWEFWGMLLQPGLGFAVQLDGDEKVRPLLALDFRY